VFCPSALCESVLVAFIENTSSTLDCSFYDLQLENVLDALKKKSATSKVRIVIDNVNKKRENTLPFVRFDTSSQYSHNKFCVKDSSVVLTGSMNPTFNGAYNNDNSYVIIASHRLSQNYEEEFEELWSGEFGKGRSVRYERIIYNNEMIENYFCPEDHCAQHIINAINKAQQSIYFATFSFTHKDIAQALIDAHNRGITVSGIVERRANSRYHVKPLLEASGIYVAWDENPATMHHKVFLIDNTTIIGSMNPSVSGDTKNDENILILHSEQVTEHYRKLLP
jgi:phosphatidylserine/phosphatidylglycerophosphate/cardiolipin synthase-like enzyme